MSHPLFSGTQPQIGLQVKVKVGTCEFAHCRISNLSPAVRPFQFPPSPPQAVPEHLSVKSCRWK